MRKGFNCELVLIQIQLVQNYFFSWLKRVPLLKTSEESAWLFHEIGRCYWEAGNYTDAKEYGEKSQDAAEESHDQFWQLNASMLIAQTEGKQRSIP